MNVRNLSDMKCISQLFVLFCAWPHFTSAQLTNNGATIVVTPGTQLVLNNISFQNEGVFNQTAGTVQFTGSDLAFISGSITPRFYNLTLNKQTGILRLQNSLHVGNELRFSNGRLDLNTYNILLDGVASLANENLTSFVYGPLGGYIEITRLLNVPTADNPGNLGAAISSSQNLGAVTIRRGHRLQTIPGSGTSILRYYDISPANNTALDATLRFGYLDEERNGLTENSLTVWKSNNNVNWTHLGKTSNSALDNYVEETGISDFARFTLAIPSASLPLVWGSFHVQCQSGRARIGWNTEQEQNTSAFIIRRSTDARNWADIGTLPAAGNSNNQRSYFYEDPRSSSGRAYYQIWQKDIDGRLTVSPVLSTECGTSNGVKVFPNPVQNGCWVNIHSPGSGSAMLRLFDNKGALILQQGRTVLNGNNQFELQLDKVAKGLYSLAVTFPDGGTEVVKIEKN